MRHVQRQFITYLKRDREIRWVKLAQEVEAAAALDNSKKWLRHICDTGEQSVKRCATDGGPIIGKRQRLDHRVERWSWKVVSIVPQCAHLWYMFARHGFSALKMVFAWKYSIIDLNVASLGLYGVAEWVMCSLGIDYWVSVWKIIHRSGSFLMDSVG